MKTTMVMRNPDGTVMISINGGEWEPKPLTQIPDQPLALVPDLTAPTYGSEISKAFAQARMQWGVL